MIQDLEGFIHRMAHQIYIKKPHDCRTMYELIYPPIDKVLEEVGLWTTNTYIGKCQNTVSYYVTMQPIFELCSKEEWTTGSQSSRRWWDPVGQVSEGKMEE